MGLDLLRRVRWTNLARLVGTLAVVAAVVAWPRLAPPAPQVPGNEARPLDGLGEVAPVVTPPGEPLVPHHPLAPRRSAPRKRPDRARASPPSRPRRRRGRRTSRAVSGDDSGGGTVPGDELGGGTVPGDESGGGSGGSGGSGGTGGGGGTVSPGAPAVDPAQEEFGFEGG